MHYRLAREKGELMSGSGDGPSENEGRRIRDADGVYEVIGGRRCWVECSEEKRRALEMERAAEG